jgi:hypothetical protein
MRLDPTIARVHGSDNALLPKFKTFPIRHAGRAVVENLLRCGKVLLY